jgi:hypothetical protein
MTTITELKQIKDKGFSQVYASNAALQKLHVSQETEESKADRLEERLKADSRNYNQQLRVKSLEYTNLEKKLEQIRNLIADKQTTLNKLKSLVKRGEI